MIDRRPAVTSIALAFAALAALRAASAIAVDVVPTEQQRSASAFVIVPPCSADEFGSDAAPGFDLFAATVTAAVGCDDASATAVAEQESSIEPSAFVATGSVWSEANSSVPSTIHAIASSTYSVTFIVGESCRYDFTATLTAGSSDAPIIVLSGASVQLTGRSDVFEHTLEPPDGGGKISQDIFAAGILKPGTYIVRATAASVIDNEVPPSRLAQAHYMMHLNLTEPGDVDGDGDVDIGDLLHLLSDWGVCPATPCPADVNGDGFVNIEDLLLLLIHWG